MKRIPLTRGKFALVDDADYERLKQWNWIAAQDGYTFYAVRRVYVAKYKQGTEAMHRLILGLQFGDGKQTHHRDGNGLNNQQSNLRACTNQQNCQSRRKRKDGASRSRYKGVRWRSKWHKWQSRIVVNKKEIHLGYFLSEADAAQAYNQAAQKYFGEFALLNTL